MARYDIEVRTGDVDNAGTDAKVFIQLFGARGSSSERRIDDKHDNFERGRTDRFSLELDDVGWVDRIRVRHDNSDNKPGWFLDRVTVTDVRRDLSYRFDVNQWLTRDRGLEVEPTVTVGPVELKEGRVASRFVGHKVARTDNRNGVSSQDNKIVLEDEVKVGSSFEHTEATTGKLNVSVTGKLGFSKLSFLESSIGLEISRTVGSVLNATEEKTEKATRELEFTLPAGSAVTHVMMVVQEVVLGKAVANGVEVPFEVGRLPSLMDVHTFDGLLSDPEVEAEVERLLEELAGEPPTPVAPGLLLAVTRLPGPITAMSIDAAVTRNHTTLRSRTNGGSRSLRDRVMGRKQALGDQKVAVNRPI